MAEIRNTFVKSKMNKDLDDRLLSKGEYRNAENVQISRSEGEDVGALENVLGNALITDWDLNTVDNLEIIGYIKNDATDRAYFIATNYTDTSADQLSNPAPYGASCYILMFDNKATLSSDRYKILVQGRFLNFSKTHPVYGIDLIEDLLFWTDNRNQPRKINVNKAIADNTYYTTEDQISVAKYYPHTAPFLHNTLTIRDVTSTGSNTGPHTGLQADLEKIKAGMWFDRTSGGFQVQVARVDAAASEFYTSSPVFFGFVPNDVPVTYSSCNNVTDEYLVPSNRGIAATVAGTTITINDSSLVGEVLTDMLVECPGKINEKITVVSHSYLAGVTTINLSGAVDAGVNSLAALDYVTLAWPNPYYISTWPGDSQYLSEKFVRFAYRFKFDDGEYSLISPFTQPAFIPKQLGYVTTKINPEDQTNAYPVDELNILSSTIVKFFENNINQVGINIETPYAVNTLADKLKISEIDILYKEAQGLAIQVIETIPMTDDSITTNSSNTISFNYQSKNPFKTLPERETTRVFDKAPIRALTQSVTGNRVIYGNFIDKHTPPQNLDYSCLASKKYINGWTDPLTPGKGYSTISYPTHTLKQNRTYQVGIVLSDRYGRQSDVVLSSITDYQYSSDGGDTNFDGSTIYHPYYEESPNAAIPSDGNLRWMGDSLKVMFRNKIPSTQTYAEGYPGLYKSGEYTAQVVPAGGFAGIIPVDDLDSNVAVGDIVTGVDSGGSDFVSSIQFISGNTLTLSQSITISGSATITIHGPENKLGWYSYKVVVKQQQQEYYNAYLPSLLQGTPAVPGSDVFGGYTVLLSDNINKIPADLGEVQPEQTQFRTSDEVLYPRVAPIGSSSFLDNKQVYVGNEFVTIDTIGKLSDLQPAGYSAGPPITANGIWKAASNPPLAEVSFYNTGIGATGGGFGYGFAVTVFEVKPPTSRLNIFWETSTSGLISELNQLIEDGPTAEEELPSIPDVPE